MECKSPQVKGLRGFLEVKYMQITDQLAENARRNCRPYDYARAAIEDMKARAMHASDSGNMLYEAYPGLKRSEAVAPGVAKLELNGHKYHAKREGLKMLYYRDGAMIEATVENEAVPGQDQAVTKLRRYLEEDFRELNIGAQAVIATEVRGSISYTTAHADSQGVTFTFLNGDTGEEYTVAQKDMESYLAKIIDPKMQIVNCPSKELAASHAYAWIGRREKGETTARYEMGL